MADAKVDDHDGTLHVGTRNGQTVRFGLINMALLA